MLLLAAALSQNGRIPVLQGHEKCIFETPHKEIKSVLSITESYFNAKNGSEFSHFLTVRAESGK